MTLKLKADRRDSKRFKKAMYGVCFLCPPYGGENAWRIPRRPRPDKYKDRRLSRSTQNMEGR